jgi:hypothetical protein
MGYSPTQKGYRCWSPSEKRFFVSMDVAFMRRNLSILHMLTLLIVLMAREDF